MLVDQINPKGQLTIVVTNDATGIESTNISVSNLVVTTGKNWMTSRLTDTGISGGSTIMTYMAIGANTQVAAVTDTALFQELGRVALVTAGGVVTSNTITYVGTFPAGTGTGSVTEAAILNAVSAGTMLARTTFGLVTKGAGDTMSVTWQVTLP